jgi:hypothetical protein
MYSQMLSWFTNDTAPINFGMLYIPEPDTTEHKGDVFGQVDGGVHA